MSVTIGFIGRADRFGIALGLTANSRNVSGRRNPAGWRHFGGSESASAGLASCRFESGDGDTAGVGREQELPPMTSHPALLRINGKPSMRPWRRPRKEISATGKSLLKRPEPDPANGSPAEDAKNR